MTPNEEAPRIFAYLDHNILDLMIKGDPLGTKALLKNASLIPVFSDETLKEIYGSKGHEQNFLNLLKEIEAWSISLTLDDNYKPTGQAQITSICPIQKYEQFVENLLENPDGDFGFSEIGMKFYGGKQDVSFAEVLSKPIEGVMQNLLSTLDDLDYNDIPENMLPHIENLKTLASELPDLMQSQTASMTVALDKMETSPLAGFEEATGIGPSILKNLNPPMIVQQVWDLVSDKLESDAIELETFFGIKSQPYDPDPDRERTLQEKVNAIYHQLNFLGYYRDSNMKKERRFKASFSDMTHAGIAAFCHVFICRDGDLVMKTKAAFDYLGIKTVVLFYPSEKQIRSDMVTQFKQYMPTVMES